MCDPQSKTKCDPIYGADGNTKVCAALKFPKMLSTTCGGSKRPFKYFPESGGRQPWIMPPYGTQSSFPPSLLCTSPKGFKSKVSCFSLPYLFPTAGGVAETREAGLLSCAYCPVCISLCVNCLPTFFCFFHIKVVTFFLIKLFIILGASSLTVMHVAYILFYSVLLKLNFYCLYRSENIHSPFVYHLCILFLFNLIF